MIQTNKQRFKIMLGYRQRTPCRNGPSCYYYHHGHCWFYHPDWHQEINQLNHQHNQQFSISIQVDRMSEEDNEQSFNSFQEIDLNSQNFQFHSFRSYINSGYLQELNIANWGLNKQNQGIRKEKQPMKLIVKQKQIPLIKIESVLAGNKKWYFQNIPHYLNFPQNETQQCPICLSSFNQTQLISLLYCTHSFHSSCIQKWLQTSSNCPLCRKDYRKHEKYEELEGFSDNQISDSESDQSNSLYGFSDYADSISIDSDGNSIYEDQEYYDSNDLQIQIEDQMSFEADE